MIPPAGGVKQVILWTQLCGRTSFSRGCRRDPGAQEEAPPCHRATGSPLDTVTCPVPSVKYMAFYPPHTPSPLGSRDMLEGGLYEPDTSGLSIPGKHIRFRILPPTLLTRLPTLSCSKPAARSHRLESGVAHQADETVLVVDVTGVTAPPAVFLARTVCLSRYGRT